MQEWFILAFFMIVVGIPVIFGVGGQAFKRWLRYKETMATAINAQAVEKAAQYAAYTERLEQRVRVLERIATDKGVAIADEIEQLRDDHQLN